MDSVAKLYDIRSFILESNHIKVVYVPILLILSGVLPSVREYLLEKNHTNVDMAKLLTCVQDLLNIGELMWRETKL